MIKVIMLKIDSTLCNFSTRNSRSLLAACGAIQERWPICSGDAERGNLLLHLHCHGDVRTDQPSRPICSGKSTSEKGTLYCKGIYCESRNIRRLDLVKFVINKIISLMKIFMVSCLMWLYKKMIFSSGKTMSDLKSTKFNLQKQFCFCTCVLVYI